MPKQVLQVTNFAGGLNAYSDARDIEDNQFVQNWNAVVDKNGIIRVSGMAADSISTEYFDNTNFQKGHGLFQFTTDYSLSEIDGDFKTGITTGTIATYASTSSFTLEDKTDTSSVDDFYNDFIIYIYSGTGKGESRKITDYTGSSRTVTSVAFATTLHDKDDATPSKYIIYRWTPSSDFLGDGTNNFDYIEEEVKDYSLVSKSGNVSTNTSNPLGYVDFEPKLSLVPGDEYTISFDCKASTRYYNAVSNGDDKGIVDTGINSNESEVAISTSEVTLTVDGTTATDALIKGKGIYKSDGTFIGMCTSVDSGTQIKLDKAEVAIPNDTDLYTGGGYADKVPWVELYSTTVADTKGSIKTLTASASGVLVFVSSESNVSGNWEADKTHKSIITTSTSGEGTGALFNVIVDGSGNHTVRLIPDKAGQGYVIGDTILLTDPGSTSHTIELTVASINMTGLSLISNGNEGLSYAWLKGIDGDGTASGYITKQDSNYIDNGDFRTTILTEWDLVNHDEGAVHGLTAAIGSTSESYDGLASSLKLTTTIQGINGPGDGWISQTVTLDELTPYALNFLYSARHPHGRAEVRVLDPSGDVLFEKSLQCTTGLATPVYRWVNQIPLSENTDNFSYIQFNTPASITSASTVACKIQFRPVVNNVNDNYFFVHGVTLHKNYFDLSNMSFNNPETNNPFRDTVTGYSRYSLKFTVPHNYSSVSDWVFRIHAGKYGWIDNNDLNGGSENSQSQNVNIKNIKITSPFISSNETKETVTLLMDNAAEESSILAHTSSSSSWNKYFLSFNGTNVKPVYNYINGMLKISDGNFLNNNDNKLVYYSTRSIPNMSVFPKWVKRSNSMISPPLLSVSQNDDDNISSAIFDCNKYFNKYFEGYKLRENDAPDATLSGGSTNWPLDSFGPTSYNGNNIAGVVNPVGLLTRYFQSRLTKTTPGGRIWSASNGYSTDSEISEYQHLLNPDSQFYHDTYLSDMGLEFDQGYLDSYFGGDEDGTYTIGNLGYKGIGGDNYATHSALVNKGIGPPEYNEYYTSLPTYNLRNPVCLAIEPSAFSDLTNFTEIPILPDNPFENIKSIDIKFKAEYLMWSTANIFYDYMVPPVFDFSVGVLGGVEQGSDLLASHINADNMDFKSNTEHISKIGDNARNSIEFPNGEGSIWKVGTGNATGCLGFTDRYDSLGKLTSLNIDRGIKNPHILEYYHDFRGEGACWKVTMNIEDSIEIPIDGTPINTNNDTLLIKLTEYVDHGGVEPSGNGGYGIHAGWGCYGQIEGWGGTAWNTLYATYSESGGWPIGSETELLPGTGEHTGFYSRYIIEEFKIGFWNQEVDPVIELGENNVGINFSWGSTESEGVGWADRIFEIATTSVNVFGEESCLSSSSGILGENADGSAFIKPGEAPAITFKMKKTSLDDIFTIKTKIYMRDTESEIWYLQCYLDHEKRRFHSNTSFKSADASIPNALGEIEWFLDRDNFKNFNEVASYESETMVSQDDGVSNDKLTARYKTSTIANNRMYVGNIMQESVIHGDRMLKSPIGKYNILPASSFVDVAINDGDEITALAYYKDKILQFKKRKVFAINISGDYEFLEDTFDNVGVLHQASVTKTPHGIVWANKTGCYLYDGEEMTNLIENKIPSTSDYATITNNFWLASTSAYDGACIIGYIQSRDTLLVRWQADTNVAAVSSPEAITYHFPTKSWCFNNRGISGNIVESDVGALSNMITDTDGELLYYRFQSGSSYNSIKKWENSPLATGSTSSASGSSKVFQFSTKDFTFGDIVNRKKIYKVYITYKVGTDGTDSGITAEGAINGSGDFTEVDFSTDSTFTGGGNCYDSSTLNETDAKWKIAELKFATPGDVNNIYSFQLKLSGSAVPEDFEINDISIVYRTKSTK